MLDRAYGPARYFFEEAERVRPRRVENLHDLGACSVMIARERFEQMNHAAAMRELDKAIGYYTQAIEVYPGHQASIEGKNVALELKGQFDEALKHAEWAAKFVGPSAKQYVFLAEELEERGDVDGAMLRYRQAVAVEPDNPKAHVAFARFLLRSKNEPAAVHHLQLAYRLDPSDDWVVDQLAARGAVPPLAPETARTP
jgi:tetratricopeptide (TPR) repeat protein